MTIIEKAEQLQRKIRGLTDEMNKCGYNKAAKMLFYGLWDDRERLCHELGLLVSNSGIKICLQSNYTRMAAKSLDL